MQDIENTGSPLDSFEARTLDLQRRVAEAARVLTQQGVRPTVTRIRAALGGGSPNDLTPALKAWRESSAAVFEVSDRKRSAQLPVQIADLCLELWQRASTAAAVELKGGAAARQAITQDAATGALQAQVRELREQLQRELISYGELRGQAARHEAVARDALKRLEESEGRGRRQLRDLGEARARVVELEAITAQRRERLASTAITRDRKPKAPKRKVRLTTRSKPRAKKASQQRVRHAVPRPSSQKAAKRKKPGPKRAEK